MKTLKQQILLSLIFIFIFHCLSYSQGSTYGGTYVASAPIVKNGVSNITISGLQISNTSGSCITLVNCSNITIQNCKLGPSSSIAVDLNNCTNITVTNCSMANVASGLHAYMGSGISFIYNDVQNVVGPYPRGQMAQFDNVSGTGNRINFNSCDNISGQSNPEDLINIYMSNGTVNDPIQANGNWLRGGGPSLTGGGMLVGDNGGSYQIVENNICVNTGHEGIQIAGGHCITIRNNKVYSQLTSVSGVGVVVAMEPIAPCSVQNNQINWTRADGLVKNLYNAAASGVVSDWGTNTYDPTLNASILPTKIIGRTKAVTTEIDSSPALNEIKIYPNPATDHITIESSQDLTIGSIAIYNIKGQKLIEQSIKAGNTDLDTHNFAKGVYIMKISSNNQQLEQRKLIIGNR